MMEPPSSRSSDENGPFSRNSNPRQPHPVSVAALKASQNVASSHGSINTLNDSGKPLAEHSLNGRSGQNAEDYLAKLGPSTAHHETSYSALEEQSRYRKDGRSGLDGAGEDHEFIHIEDDSDEISHPLVRNEKYSVTQAPETPNSRHPSPMENHKRRQSQVDSVSQGDQKEKVLKMTPAKIHELTSSPRSIPLRTLDSTESAIEPDVREPIPSLHAIAPPPGPMAPSPNPFESDGNVVDAAPRNQTLEPSSNTNASSVNNGSPPPKAYFQIRRPVHSPRSTSSPTLLKGAKSSHLTPHITERRNSRNAPTPLRFTDGKPKIIDSSIREEVPPSPMPKTIPLPPMSLPTILQLELSSHRPSPLYIHRSVTSDFPYESSRVKIERLLNFLLLPPQLEQVLWFGTLACLDAWLYTFTILPLRLLKSFYILGQSWAINMFTEAQYLSGFVYAGTGRMWKRRRDGSMSKPSLERTVSGSFEQTERSERTHVNGSVRSSSVPRRNSADRSSRRVRRHKRNKSVPSDLLPDDKADILKGLLIICTCILLMRLDASREYHWIRGQAAIKLYVIYNVLEVGDRLLSAIGQDVLECLFSREALERGPDGHSKVIRPFWLFLLALAYTVAHSTALFYQVITLNVAVNSYSNALITLLMSNQFVEIKSTVFKKFEKENLFQLTCADVVERFQLWLMLLIIASRNFVETGGLSARSGSSRFAASAFTSAATSTNDSLNQPPLSAASILPRSFTLLPDVLSSLTAYAPSVGHVLGPFLVVLGSEMIIDSLKHCYINKFNNARPAIYGRFLDVLAKDYYSNAFADQNLTKRLGLPVIPLSCLFIRASVQTYYMFRAAWIPSSLPSAATGLSSAHSHYSSSTTPIPTSTTAALSQRLDQLLRHLPTSISSSSAFANFSTILIFLLLFLILLAFKLVLGMALLAFARWRYRGMKEREKNSIHHVEGGKRVGGWGVVEVDEDKRRWIYEGDPEGLRRAKERDEKERVKRERERAAGAGGGGGDEGAFERVKRYEMVAKRIW